MAVVFLLAIAIFFIRYTFFQLNLRMNYQMQENNTLFRVFEWHWMNLLIYVEYLTARNENESIFVRWESRVEYLFFFLECKVWLPLQ